MNSTQSTAVMSEIVLLAWRWKAGISAIWDGEDFHD